MLVQTKVQYIVVLLLLSSCRSYNTFVEHKVDRILKKYGNLESLKDTIINDNNIIREYRKGNLSKIGHIGKNGLKKGKWYMFEELSLYYIVKYKHDKADTILKPVRIVNKVDW